MDDEESIEKRNEEQTTRSKEHRDVQFLLERINRFIDQTNDRFSILEQHQKDGYLQVRTLAGEVTEIGRQIRAQSESKADYHEVNSLGDKLNTLKSELAAATAEGRTQITNVKEQLDKNKKGRVEKIGAFLGYLGVLGTIILGVLGGPKAFREFKEKVDTSVMTGWPLRVSYQPEKKQLGFAFTLKIANNGGRNDTIREAAIRVETEPSQGVIEPLYLSPGGLQLFEKQDVPVRLPFEVATTSPRELTCVITSELGDTELNDLRQPRLRHLVVQLAGERDRNEETNNYRVDFCFYLTPNLIKALFDSGAKAQRDFENQHPSCETP